MSFTCKGAALRAWPLAVLLAACGSGRIAGPVVPAANPLERALAAAAVVRAGPLPSGTQWQDLEKLRSAVLCSDGWRQIDPRLSEDARARLRKFIEAGGRVLLLGYASALAVDLGLEERPPDVCEPFRWGLDARTALGRSRLGFRHVSDRAPGLVEDLKASGAEHCYALTGGEGVSLQGCWWEGYAPKKAEVLGRLLRERDGTMEPTEAAVLLRWTLGKGSVLACGVVPDPTSTDANARGNATAFLANTARWLETGSREPVALWWLPAPHEPEGPHALPPLGQRELPAEPLLAHWGWQTAVRELRSQSDPVTPQSIVDDVLLPSFRAGADLLDLQLGETAHGYPLAWLPRDPLRKPEHWRGGTSWPEWNGSAIARICREAHARGMLVQTFLAPEPCPGGSLQENFAGVRFLARELMDVRRLQGGAVDGFGVKAQDPRGLLLALAQDFLPSAHAYAISALPLPSGGVVRIADAQDGRPRGLDASGLSERFRGGFPADLYPAGRLDCRVRPPDPALWGDQCGGGNYADWLVTQANDFVRARMGRGAAMWWQGFDPEALAKDAAAVVQGISLDPIRAAVAGRHLATGKGGWRDLQRGFVAEVQSGFGSEAAVPEHGPFLQNNWLKLCGSGGGLLFDAQGLGRFREGEAVLLAAEWMRTRLSGGRPGSDDVRAERVDLLAAGRRAEGGFARDAGSDIRVPALLARGELPHWPEQAGVPLSVGQGVYDLDLELRGVRGRGIVEVSLDGEVLQLCAFASDRPAQRINVPLHLARDGARTLSLVVAEGGAVAIDRLRLERTSDCAAEVAVGEPAGHWASLRETSSSTHHHEEAELGLLADCPGFLWRSLCQRSDRGLRMERTFRLLRHQTLVTSSGETAQRLRGPFVLQGNGVPDLAIVPLHLGRYDSFELRASGELVLSTLCESSGETKVGFFLMQEPRMDLVQVLRMFAFLDRPTELEFGSTGTAQVSSDLPFAWTRLLRMRQDSGTPYLVRENGWWLLRGAQPARGGGDWLRICQLPGDTVQVMAGAALLGSTRPGPGCARLVALKDREPAAVTVRVLQESCLLPQPSVVMEKDFDAVTIDGRPWQFFDGRTVYLPSAPGTYKIATATHAGGRQPHLVRTGARIDRCLWDAEHRELRFLARAPEGHASELPLCAIVAGMTVASVENGSVVADKELRHGNQEQALAAAAGGTLIRFQPGVVRVSAVPEGSR